MSTQFHRSVRAFSLVVMSAVVLALVSGCASMTVPFATKSNVGPSGPATVAGKVTSDRGAVLADAAITLHGLSVTRKARTDIGGRFVFTSVPLGQFTIWVSAAGYKGVKQQVTVEKEGTVQVDVRLRM
jgi:Carboxypeptidase regulatory-like domain